MEALVEVEVPQEAVEASLPAAGVGPVVGEVSLLGEAEVVDEVASGAVGAVKNPTHIHSRSLHAHYHMQFVPMEFGDEEVKFSGVIALLLYKYMDLFRLLFLFLSHLGRLYGAFLSGIYLVSRFNLMKIKLSYSLLVRSFQQAWHRQVPCPTTQSQ